MPAQEFEGKTLDDAIQLACEAFQLPQEKLDIEVLSKGSSGIFGIVGARKARIRVTPKETPLGKACDRAKQVLTEILKYVDVPTVVESEVRQESVYLNIVSNGSGLLIGKRGKTLNALQYVVSKIVSREVGDNVPVIVDTENYRSKRESNLTEMALQLSERVKKYRRPVTTGPMNAQDRRIIHMALKEDQGVRTKSKGEGNLRRVVIYPAKKTKNIPDSMTEAKSNAQ
ncbi:MAG: RNA-binding cell elongation regulator Jag/EloR [Desulfosoma sp.]|uniref:RNA-binding cell elongation regulator Jag/EloR n=1 Tax=Desulfosoma sp. TaxID=2603217 RepID=UPI00404B28A2